MTALVRGGELTDAPITGDEDLMAENDADQPTSRPVRPARLGQVLDHLGTTVVDVVAGQTNKAPDVAGVVIYDPRDEQVTPGALVLGVGIDDPSAVADAVRRLAAPRASGLVVRTPVRLDAMVLDAVDKAGIVLLELVPGASWTQLVSLLQGLLADADLADGLPDVIAGLPAGDLFAIANAASALVDAPITIEDRSLRVLAFSGRQDEADMSRIATILNRQVPERYARVLEKHGVFRKLYKEQGPIFVALDDACVTARAAIAIRAGDEILGSIWAVVDAPLSPAREQALAEVANIAALHLLRIRAGTDVRRRARSDLVATVLEGRASAPEAIARLGLLNLPVVVLAFAVTDPHVDASEVPLAAQEAARQHAADALAVHLTTMHPRSAVALLGDVTYGIMPVQDPDHGDAQAARTAGEFLVRTGARVQGRIGVGRVARTVDAVPRSRADADRALRALRSMPSERRVARLAEVHTEVLLRELAELADADSHRPSGAVGRLLEYDATHHTDLVPSLRAWLDAFGNAAVAAQARQVHVNTFRYRLRRIAEVAEADLDDPGTRFALMLELNLLETRAGEVAPRRAVTQPDSPALNGSSAEPAGRDETADRMRRRQVTMTVPTIRGRAAM